MLFPDSSSRSGPEPFRNIFLHINVDLIGTKSFSQTLASKGPPNGKHRSNYRNSECGCLAERENQSIYVPMALAHNLLSLPSQTMVRSWSLIDAYIRLHVRSMSDLYAVTGNRGLFVRTYKYPVRPIYASKLLHGHVTFLRMQRRCK